jgi:membrane protein
MKQVKARIERLKVAIQYSRFARYPPVVLAWRVIQEMGNDDAPHMAAGIAYYSIFSLFPLLLGILAIIGIVMNSQSQQQEFLDFVSQNLPGASGFVTRNVEGIVRLRGTLGIVSIVGLFWSASAVFGAITRAVNRAWEVREDRPFYISKPRQLGTALSVLVLFVISTSISSAIQFITGTDLGIPGQSFLREFGLGQWALRVLSWFITFGIFLLIYCFVPNRKIYWQHVWLGAVIAAILFEVGKALFVWYLGQFANYSQVYGSLASVIVLLLWLYLSSLVLILGAEIGSEDQKLRNPEQTQG